MSKLRWRWCHNTIGFFGNKCAWQLHYNGIYHQKVQPLKSSTIHGLNFLIIKLFNQSSLVELYDYQKVQLYKFNMLLYYIYNKKWTTPVVVPEGHNTTYLPWNLRCFCNSFNTIQATLFPIGIASSSSELVKLFKGWTFWYIPLSESSTKVWSNFLKVEPSDKSRLLVSNRVTYVTLCRRIR